MDMQSISNHHHGKLLLIAILFPLLHSATHHHQQQQQPDPNCTRRCGSVDIPFPFGTIQRCAYDSSFLINCNNSTPYPSNTFNTTLLNISLDGHVRVSWPVASDCTEKNGDYSMSAADTFASSWTPFTVSTKWNKLTVVGCDTIGVATGFDSTNKPHTNACASFCKKNEIIANESSSCPTAGCSAIEMTGRGQSLMGFGYLSTSLNYHKGLERYNPCGYAFVVEVGMYQFKREHLSKFQKNMMFPVVLHWAVGNKTCEEAKEDPSSYACKADKSFCFNSSHGVGYLCNCSTGFYGNPYLPHGCKDINECNSMETNDCIHRKTCLNTEGNYTCKCPKGLIGDGKHNGTRCTLKSSTTKFDKSEIYILITALVISVSLIALLVMGMYAYWGSKKRRMIKLREHFFQQNGGLLLQQEIARYRGSTDQTAKIFTVQELKNATNGFDDSKILGKGGQGTVYRGLLRDNRTVAIKKSMISDSNQIEHFINEVIVLSQINHRNVVKLLGCCLETQVPLLVYEFITSGTVSDHLYDHDHSQYSRLTWRTRLRIAAETAGALAYLHSSSSIPVIHRDVKTSNILLDCDLTAKVSDFGASRIVPLDKTQVTTLVQGTLGYLDPEYFHTSQLTEKSDVYSFGVVLAELLTGRKALSFDVPEEDRSLASFFIFSMEEGRLLDIVDRSIIDEASNVEVLVEFANVTKQCLSLRRDERPTMKEVAMELEILIIEQKQQWESDDKSSDQETDINNNLLEASSSSVFNVEDGTSLGFDSINQDLVS